MKEFKMIKSDNEDDFSGTIGNLLQLGWELRGDAIIIMDKFGYPKYFQTLIK